MQLWSKTKLGASAALLQVRNISSKAADAPYLVSDQVGNVSSKATDEPDLVSDQVRNVSSKAADEKVCYREALASKNQKPSPVIGIR